MKNVYKILVENLNGRLFLKDLGVDGIKILALKSRVGECGLYSFISGKGPVVGSCELSCDSIEHLNIMNVRNFLTS
jgi:hypothetical protein